MLEEYNARFGFAAITLLAVAALFALYPEVWSISPSRDDYMPPLAEVHRGMARGPWSFFVEPSTYPFYRPLTFVSIWLAGTIAMDAIITVVHGLHFLWAAACLAVLALWARTLEFSRFAFAFSALIFVTHPLLAGPLASIDGFQRLASTAWTWLGAWFVVRSARGSLGGDLAAAASLALGLGFAEYTLGLVPLALLAALWRRQTGRSWLSIARLAVFLGVVVVAWYAIREGVLGPRTTALVGFEPTRWPIVAGQLIGVALFWGNSVWSMLGPQPWAAAVTAGAIALALAWLVAGMALAEPDQPRAARGWLARADVGLLVPATLVATFPTVIMQHVSEMYATPVLMSVALLAGSAAAGWLTAGHRLRRVTFAGATLAVVVGVWASWAKIEAIGAAGRQSDQQVYQILSHIPPRARDWRIATLFDATEPQPRYSVFVPWRHASEVVRTDTLAWFRPGQALELERLILPDACDRADEPFDLILYWDRADARYRPLDEEGFEARCGRPLTARRLRAGGLRAESY